MENFKCKQCGNCCLNLNICYTAVTDEDVKRWKDTGRDDILACVNSIPLGNGQYIHDIWFSATTKEEVNRCPWLRKLPNKNKYICRINDTKPEVCRNYPLSKEHAIETGCNGFNDK